MKRQRVDRWVATSTGAFLAVVVVLALLLLEDDGGKPQAGEQPSEIMRLLEQSRNMLD